ncbi:MAG: hypothetical protein LBJ96_01305 [Holosporaceae bacterium]|nr:hypothetical protein [Holosporaceae bacterium]
MKRIKKICVLMLFCFVVGNDIPSVVEAMTEVATRTATRTITESVVEAVTGGGMGGASVFVNLFSTMFGVAGEIAEWVYSDDKISTIQQNMGNLSFDDLIAAAFAVPPAPAANVLRVTGNVPLPIVDLLSGVFYGFDRRTRGDISKANTLRLSWWKRDPNGVDNQTLDRIITDLSGSVSDAVCAALNIVPAVAAGGGLSAALIVVGVPLAAANVIDNVIVNRDGLILPPGQLIDQLEEFRVGRREKIESGVYIAARALPLVLCGLGVASTDAQYTTFVLGVVIFFVNFCKLIYFGL